MAKNAVLQMIIDSTLEEVMLQSGADNIIVDETTKETLTERLASLSSDIAAAATPEEVDEKINEAVADINAALANKVDKVSGKGLSSNDFTDALLTKLNGIAEGANKTTVDTALSSTSTNPVQNKVINTALAAKAPLASPALTGTPTAPTASSSTNNTQLATTAFVQSLVNAKIAAADAMIYKGTLGTDGTITALPATHSIGWTYKVITAGTYAGQKCEVGDMVVCLKGGTAAADADWTVIQSNIDGAVTGPASAVDARVAVFSGTTGKVIKDSGYTIAKSVPSSAVFTDTHYTATNVVGASATATANAATTNGSTYMNLIENGTVRNSHLIKGSGATSVTSDANGAITINSINTTYSAATTSTAGLMSANDKSKLDAITASATNVAKSTTNGNILINNTETVVYTHPTTAGNKHIPSGGAAGQVLTYGGSSGTATWATPSSAIRYGTDIPSDLKEGELFIRILA